MIRIPGAYDPYAPVRCVGASVDFAMVAVEATPANLTVQVIPAERNAFFSEPQQIVSGIVSFTKKIATMETDGWILDGTYDYVDDVGENGQIGFWGNSLSAFDGTIPTTTIQISATVPFAVQAITIIFDEVIGVWATDFSCTYSGGAGETQTYTITDNNKAVVEVGGCDFPLQQLTLTFDKINLPGKLLRICQILMGQMIKFEADEIGALSCTYESSLYAESFPSSQLRVTIDNSAKEYNIANPRGVYKYLQQGQGLNATIIVDGYTVTMGRFYFSGVESTDDALTATITAYDRAWLLDSAVFTGGSDGVWYVNDALDAILAAAGLNIRYEIPAYLYTTEIKRAIPSGTTCREAIRLVAQASKCVCFFSRLEVLTFVQPATGDAQDTLNFDRLMQYPDITVTDNINAVDLIVRNEYTGTEVTYYARDVAVGDAQQIITIENPLVNDGPGVVDWILTMCRYRTAFVCDERGNPAREPEDIVTIYDAYGGQSAARVLSEEFKLKIGLTGKIKAVFANV